jgi:hypothetical protein
LTSRQEAQWVLRAQLGDREAIEALLRSVQPMLNRYVRAIVGPRAAEDVTQDVMVTIYRKLEMLSSTCSGRGCFALRAGTASGISNNGNAGPITCVMTMLSKRLRHSTSRGSRWRLINY